MLKYDCFYLCIFASFCFVHMFFLISGSSTLNPVFSPYDLTFNQQFPPPYSAEVPEAPKYSPPPYSNTPPPYSAKNPAQRSTLHSIGSDDNLVGRSNASDGPPPVS